MTVRAFIPWPHRTKIKFLPQTYLGKWAVGLIVAFLIFLGLLVPFAVSGQTFHENLWLTIPVLIVYGAGISFVIVGLISIMAKGERSFLVFIAVGMGLLFIIFELEEILHY